MDQLLTFEFEEVQNSIVTPTSIAFGDYLQPYTFIEFLKNTNNNYTPKVYNEFYIEYLKRWADVKGNLVVSEAQVISSQYTDLLREISLTYSTLEERKFLANINFNDPEDLEIAIPFFTRKIKEIVLLYKSSRDKLTFQIEKNKRKGTENSVQVALRENILRFLFNSNRFSALNIPISSVNSNIKIQIDDLVDTYGSYFNLELPEGVSPENLTSVSPRRLPLDFDVGGPQRAALYTANTNEIDYTDFVDLNEFLKKYVFSRTFITQLGKSFTINADLTYDPICEPENVIGDFLEEQTVGGVTPEQFRELRAKLVKKFIGVDYYYVLKNGAGEVFTGLLFQADNPCGNLLNVNTASTATVPSDELKSLRKIGLYFAPERQSVIRFNKTENSYTVDLDALQPNVTYVYPSPELYAKKYGSDYPFIFYYDVTSVFKNDTNSFAFGDPINDSRQQNFYAYYTRQQTSETQNVNDNRLVSSFSSLFNLGYVQDWKKDVYGNEYALVKDKDGQFFKPRYYYTDIVGTGSIVKFLPLNGWVFNDPVEGSNFDYDVSGPYEGFDGVIKSGVTLSGGNFVSTDVDYYLNFRQFSPYQGIPSQYNLYPSFFSSPLLRTVPVSGSMTEVSSLTGDYTPKTITERNSLSGVIYVRDAVTGNVSTLSSALTATYTKYPQQVKDQLYTDVKTFDVFYSTIAVRTTNYLIIDKINYNSTGFIKPDTFNVYLSTANDTFDNISNLFFVPARNIILFYRTRVLDEYKEDNNRVIYPEVYQFDIDKHVLTKLFPSASTPINSVSSNFTFLGVYSAENVVEIGSQKLSYNKTNELYCISMMGYDGNKSPYLFDHKFAYDGENFTFKYSNVYDTNNYKSVSNFYSLSDNGQIYVSTVGGNKALSYTSFNFVVSATSFASIVLNNDQGYLQL